MYIIYYIYESSFFLYNNLNNKDIINKIHNNYIYMNHI